MNLINSKFYIAFVFFLGFYSLKAQNLFDLDNSKKFANYLFEKEMYDQASLEYLRIIKMQKSDTLSWRRLLVSTAKNNQWDLLLTRTAEAKSIPVFDPYEAERWIALGSIMSHQANASFMIQSLQQLENSEKCYFLNTSFALNGNWQAVNENLVNNCGSEFYIDLMGQMSKEKSKSPFLASSMSAIIPGTGKIYGGRWKDGLFSLLLVGTSAYQSYRGFSKQGKSSLVGWFFGGMGLGLYVGNIYGSGKVAKDFNQSISEKYKLKAERNLRLRFGI